MSEDILITFKNVSKRFGKIWAVNHLNLEIKRGCVFGLLGPNGAGKSTTLYMMTGLVSPTSGKITIEGCDVSKGLWQIKHSIGIVFENPSFYEYLSARQNLELISRLSNRKAKGNIDEVLSLVNLTQEAERKVSSFSRGMRQRLAIAQALLSNPSLLILDEPTDGLDPEGTYLTLSFLKKIVREQNATIVVSSHLLSVMEEFCDEVAIINKGKLCISGKVEDLHSYGRQIAVLKVGQLDKSLRLLSKESWVEQAQAIDEFTLKVKLANSTSAKLNEFLVQKGIPVYSLTLQKRSLKDLFLELTKEKKDV